MLTMPDVVAELAGPRAASDSGTGREGVRSAMTDLTEDRVLALTGLPL